jgi:hypothetical protein
VVEQLIIQWISTFRPERVIFDPWQAVMMQSHISRFCPTEKFSFQRDLDKMTMDLYQSIVQGAVLFYKDAGKRMHNDGQEWSLKRELLELSVVEGGRSGCRIDHQKDGHSDCVMSLGMALFYFREHSAPILGQATAKPRFFDFRL